MKLIGIAGFKGSGKTTVASLLAPKLAPVRILALAQPIKETLAGLFREDVLLWEDPRTKEQVVPGFSFKRRDAMQKFGQEFGRSLDKNLWINLLDQRLKSETKGCNVVISDVRYISESEYILDQGGEIIEVLSNDTKAGEHESEQGLPARYIKHRIFNDKNKPFDNLIKQVDDLIPLLL